MSAGRKKGAGLLLILAALITAVIAGGHTAWFGLLAGLAMALALGGAVLTVMPFSIRSVLAIIAALFLIAVVMVGGDQIFEGVLLDLSATAQPKFYILMMSMVLALFSSLVAGWTACTVAKSRDAAPAIGMMIILEVGAVAVVGATWSAVPKYLSIPFLFLLPIAVRLGGVARDMTITISEN